MHMAAKFDLPCLSPRLRDRPSSCYAHFDGLSLHGGNKLDSITDLRYVVSQS